ncbi:MAG TPA: VOC family protein [Bacillales bacterium]|nr:VOC family protein [Bacillales bacterium]
MKNEGFQSSITPMLAVRKASDAIAFYKKGFGATEVMRLTDSDGRISHCELAINGASIMLADEYPEHNRTPQTLGGSSVILHITVDFVDDVVEQALAEGATLVRPVQDQPHGHRNGKIEDPFGHVWMISTPL